MKLLITIISACTGMGAAAGYVIMFRAGAAPRGGGREFDLHIFLAMGIMLIVAGQVGQWLYRLTGSHKEAAIARNETAAHARILLIVAAVILLGSAFFAWRAEGKFPAVNWVPVLIGLAVLLENGVGWYFGRSNPELAGVPIECPVCRSPSESIKLYDVFDRFLFLGLLFVRERKEAACPSCMRSILWRRCLANLVTANLLWPVWVFPRTVIMVVATFSRGHSRGIEVDS